MRNINFKQPKYIIPLLALPFLLLFFYVYKSSIEEDRPSQPKQQNAIQTNIGGASEAIQKSGFSDKLEAFRNQYKEADGNTAINPIAEDASLDSIDQMMKRRIGLAGPSAGVAYSGSAQYPYQSPGLSGQDQQLTRALASLNNPGYQSQPVSTPSAKEKDPMELFKAQMAYMDSVSKAQDPDFQYQQLQKATQVKQEELKKGQLKLQVSKADSKNSVFNTLLPGTKADFITAIIDEDVTGYAGSRIRLRLLEEVVAGNIVVSKGTYLYAEISGFSGQRVSLQVSSILTGGKILPVKLELYDLDGLKGLYVPESAFRDFSKDLGGNSVQGVNIQGTAQNQSQFLMSSLDRVFQSTSSAIASLIRKNKAHIKYSSFIYLIDPDQLQDQQKNY